jgi:hypothetical protein
MYLAINVPYQESALATLDCLQYIFFKATFYMHTQKLGAAKAWHTRFSFKVFRYSPPHLTHSHFHEGAHFAAAAAVAAQSLD